MGKRGTRRKGRDECKNGVQWGHLIDQSKPKISLYITVGTHSRRADTARGIFIDNSDNCRFHLKSEMVERNGFTRFTMQESDMSLSQTITETSCRRSPGCWRQSPVFPAPPTPTPTRAPWHSEPASPKKTFLRSFSTNLYVWCCQRNYKRAEREEKKKEEVDCEGIKTLVDRREKERLVILMRGNSKKVLHGRTEVRRRCLRPSAEWNQLNIAREGYFITEQIGSYS